MDSILGKTILGYKVKEKIGTGGFGDVYKVERNNIVGNVTRALKVVTLPKENQYMEILNSMGGDSEKADNYFRQELERVVNEIRVFSMISEKDNHNIVSYYENDVQKVEKYKYNIYILMEMLTPLDKWLTMNNLTVEQGIEIGLGVAKALKICHENKIMHRDIKLNNIFVSKDGKFKLGDFGVSKRLDNLTRANTIKGTPHYIAPEVYMGNSKYNNSVDIYSLGILMYYLFNKRRFPFYPDYPSEYTQEDEDRGFYKRMAYETPSAPICAPESVADVILRALSKPEFRYKNANEFIVELEEAKSKLSAAELNEKIGFDPIDLDKLLATSKKENDLVDNLNSVNEASISFEEHTVETLSEGTLIVHKRKAFIAVIVAVCLCAIGLVVGLGNMKSERKKTESVDSIVETSTEGVAATSGYMIETTTEIESVADKETEATTKKKKKKEQETTEIHTNPSSNLQTKSEPRESVETTTGTAKSTPSEPVETVTETAKYVPIIEGPAEQNKDLSENNDSKDNDKKSDSEFKFDNIVE